MSKHKPLTAKQQKFLAEYLIDLNAVAAYRRCFPGCTYKSAKTDASRMLSKANLKAELAAAQRDMRKRAKISAEKALRELGLAAHSDIGDLFDLSFNGWKLLPLREVPHEARRAIASLKVKQIHTKTTTAGETTTTVTTQVISVKLVDKIRALDMLFKHLGLYEPLPPLEIVLGLLPMKLAKEVRAALSEPVGK